MSIADRSRSARASSCEASRARSSTAVVKAPCCGSVLPARSDWVDAAKPKGPVVLVTGAEEATPALETAYANNSISRLYYLCRPVAGHEFGERQVTIDAAGRFHGPTGPVAAAYAVVPTRLAVQGRIVARTIPGREVLVRLPGNRLSVPPELRGAALGCGS